MKYIVILAYHYSPSTFIPAFGCSLTSSENWRSFIFCSFQKAWEWRHLPLIWLKVNISVGTVLFENSLVYWSWNSSYRQLSAKQIYNWYEFSDRSVPDSIGCLKKLHKIEHRMWNVEHGWSKLFNTRVKLVLHIYCYKMQCSKN